jgi:hypothetical protein
VPAENVTPAKGRAISDGSRIDPAFANATVAEICHLTVWNPRLLHLRARGFASVTPKMLYLLVFWHDSRALNVPPRVIMLRRDHARFLADDAGDTPVPRHQAEICHACRSSRC